MRWVTKSGKEAEADLRRRRSFRRVVTAAGVVVLAAFVLFVVVPVVRISTARPGASTTYVDQLRAMAAARVTAGSGDVGQYQLLGEAARSLETVLQPVWDEYDEEYAKRYASLYLQGGVSPRLLDKQAVDTDYYGKSEPQYTVVPEFNAFVHKYTVKASDAIENSRITEDLDRLDRAPIDEPPVPSGVRAYAVPSDDSVRTNQLLSWLSGRMKLCADRGDWAGFQRNLHRRRAVSRLLALDARRLGLITSDRIALVNACVITGAAASHEVPPPVLASLLDTLNNDPIRPDFDHAIEVERLVLLDYIEHTYSASGYRLPVAARELSASGTAVGPSLENIQGLLMPSKTEAIHAVEDFVRAMQAMQGQSRSERQGGYDTFNYLTVWNESVFDSRPLIVVPWMFKNADDSLSALNAARLVLAIELHRAAHGEPPSQLADLVPEFFADLPIDPLAPDGSFKYTLDPATPHGYRLYSVGEDGDDDGGNADAGDDNLYAPFQID